MPRRALFSVLLLCSVSLIGSLAQVPAANPPLDVKEGLWDLTQTNYNVVDMPADWLDKLPPEVTPEQRAQMLAAQKDPRSQATVEKRAVCLTREKLDQADVTQHNSDCTAIRVDSTGTSITRHSQCQGITQEAQFERIDAETFKGTQITSIPGDSLEEHMEVAAKWAGADCEGIKKTRAYAAGLAAGADPDVLSFLPFKLPHSDDAGPGTFGHFRYYWGGRSGRVPAMVYHHGLVSGGPEGVFATWLAGTDGDYLYVVLHHDPDTCQDPTALNFRLDHSGTMTRVGLLPPNLHGGRGAPCEK
ncbi:MAG TPA: DUF3617 family protein [Terracidiphilus sp.]